MSVQQEEAHGHDDTHQTPTPLPLLWRDGRIGVAKEGSLQRRGTVPRGHRPLGLLKQESKNQEVPRAPIILTHRLCHGTPTHSATGLNCDEQRFVFEWPF